MFDLKDVKFKGKVDDPKRAMIMVHGRGSNADDILSLSDYFDTNDLLYAAPQAENYSWYPYSFLKPVEENEPYLSQSLNLIDSVLAEINKSGISNDKIFLLGFSQGGCLALEYASRNAQKYFGIASLSGALIGSEINPENYGTDFSGTPIFIGCSDEDPHIPMHRLKESQAILAKMKADVRLKIYDGIGHTIIKEEIDTINQILQTNKFP